MVGEVGPASAEQAAESDGRIEEGQLTGIGGIQQAFDETLAGTPGLEVSVTRAAPADGDGAPTSAPASTEAATAGPDRGPGDDRRRRTAPT